MTRTMATSALDTINVQHWYLPPSGVDGNTLRVRRLGTSSIDVLPAVMVSS
jgi:hypothetical protein